MPLKHCISTDQFTRQSIGELFELTDDIRQNPAKYRSQLGGKIVATLFYEPSTRTRLSFEAAILRLGGGNISTENAKEMSSAIKGESLFDTIQVVQGYCDAIVIRHFEKSAAEDAASVSRVPVINAGSGSGEHPTQALLDLYTIYKRKGGLDGLRVAVMGDLFLGRTVHSLVKLLSLFKGVTIYGLSRRELLMPQEYIDYMTERGVKYIPLSDVSELPRDLDVLYHTRTQLERFKDAGLTVEEYIFDKKLFAEFSDETYLMHPLPRNKEISAELDSDPRAIYFEQSHNGMYVRMALLKMLLG